QSIRKKHNNNNNNNTNNNTNNNNNNNNAPTMFYLCSSGLRFEGNCRNMYVSLFSSIIELTTIYVRTCTQRAQSSNTHTHTHIHTHTTTTTTTVRRQVH